MSAEIGGLKNRISEEMKNAMRTQAKERLGVIRLIQAAIKQQEIDSRQKADEPVILNDEQVLSILAKMISQRREAIVQFEAGHRDDLVQKELFEIGVIQAFLPAQLSNEAVQVLIKDAIQETGAANIRDMAKVMAILKPKLQGRTDLGAVGSVIKNLLSSH